VTAQAALNAPRHRFMDWVAKKGQDGDDQVGHLSTGDAIIPVEKTRNNPRLQALLHQVYQEAKIDPRRFVVGHPQNRRNQKTGLREFADGGDGGDSGGDAGGGGSSDSGGGGGGGTSGSGPGGESPGAAGAADAPGGGPSSAPGGNSPGTASETATDTSTPTGPTAAELAGAPNISTPGVTIGTHGWLSDVQDALGLIGGDVSTPPGQSMAKMGINTAVGMLAGPAGIANSLSGAFGGPTVGGTLSSGAAAALGAVDSGGAPGTSTGSGGALGSGGGAADLPVDQAQLDSEWLKKLNLA
jgi:hypothetical protein